ncbi:hypothetical protein JAAARDRAFT_173289 [Jaapia argillacea MUCL 33604]|uniref:Cytidyltransferase-like domain-containing protein n=1 Tax=Jaapia argillacea MUCL 33604 TaxID=933084 RepID=A0A067QBS1_9AGAM|nr:hypothetical protein JAAARDRAFT_173289 [Jaapia argillacea MUCL 33604]
MAPLPVPPREDFVDHALLAASLEDLKTPHQLSPVISALARAAKSKLTIILFSPLFGSSDAGISHTEEWHDVQRLLTYVYVQATKISRELDKLLMSVDVLLKGFHDKVGEEVGKGAERLYRVAGDKVDLPLPESILSLPQTWLPPGGAAYLHPDVHYHHIRTEAPKSEPSTPLPPLYPVVALGGTFDHLHAGHKILLSMAAWITRTKIIVGVTDDRLLVKKANKEVIQDITTRMSHVTAFLALFRPGLEYEVVPIDDVYGPTAWDPDIQALVLSKETLAGGVAIDKLRLEKDLPPLRTFVIDVISATEESLDHEDADLLKQAKMSSTFIRERLVKKRKASEEGGR